MSRWLAGWQGAVHHIFSCLLLPFPPPFPSPLLPPPPPTSSAPPCSHSLLFLPTEISPLFGYLSDDGLASLAQIRISKAVRHYFGASCKNKWSRCKCLLHNVSRLIVHATYRSQWSRSYFWGVLIRSSLAQYEVGELTSASTVSQQSGLCIM